MGNLMKFCMFLIVFAVLLLVPSQAEAPQKQVNIVLVGATGDLARKYLWQSLFTLFLNVKKESPELNLQVIGASRDTEEVGTKKVNNMLRDNLNCFAPDVKWKVTDSQCAEFKMEFDGAKSYMQVKTGEHFKALSERLSGGDNEEIGRLFYLSVPPFAYEGLANNINSHARPSENAWMRVVLEKPFGSDLESAKQLAKNLGKYFKEEEMYRVDHYLGKPGVTAIESFRYENRDEMEPLWNSEHISRVDIVMKETDDVAGRTGFYDSYGVIRDVHQNHLTQIMILVGMELASTADASNSTYVQALKDNVLKEARVLQSPSTVTGQYADYVKHVHADDAKKTSSDSATWAAAVAYIDNEKWSGVPFIMMGGKALDARHAYVHIHFKPNKICVVPCPDRKIVFAIQGGDLKNPGILVSKALPKIKEIKDQKPLPESFQKDFQGGFIPLADAYTQLVDAVYHGQTDRFVGTDNLLRSWEIWTPLLKSLPKPRQYEKGGEGLNVEIVGESLRFADETSAFIGQCEDSGSKFRGSRLVSGGVSALIASLAQEITSAALLSVRTNGQFHLAVSGGSSPNILFQYLARYRKEFPWTDTHIWQVDERCVSVTDKSSNFASLQTNLLDNLPVVVKHSNVHPMPVDMQSGLCNTNDDGSAYYSKLLQAVPGGNLNYVLLGIGEDGHTASVFPGVVLDTKEPVALSDAPESTGVAKRMTLTLDYINKADRVGVLVVGARKKDIISKLGATQGKVTDLPVTAVRQDDTTWYVDEAAL